MLVLLLMGCLPEEALQAPGWRALQRDPTNPVLGAQLDSPSLVPFEDGVSGVFVDEELAGAVRDESDTGWSWGTPALIGDDVLSVTHLEAPQGTLLFAERAGGLFRGDPGPSGVQWTDLDLVDAHSPDVTRQGGAWWMAYHRDDGLYISQSDDGRVWTDPTAPVLQPSAERPWMSVSVSEPALTRGPDGLWYLLFTATDDEGVAVMGAAVSESPADPRRATWTVNPEPLLSPRNGFESHAIREPEMLVWRDVFHVWYAGEDEAGVRRIGHAGVDWPVFVPE